MKPSSVQWMGGGEIPIPPYHTPLGVPCECVRGDCEGVRGDHESVCPLSQRGKWSYLEMQREGGRRRGGEWEGVRR